MWHPQGKYVRLLILTASVALVIAYCFRHRSDLSVIQSLSALDVTFLLLLIASANLIAACKLFVMLRWLGVEDMAFRQWIQIFTVSRLANYCVAQGTNVYRAVMLKRAYSFSYSESIGVTIVVTCLDLASVGIVTGLLLLAVSQFKSIGGFLMLGIGIIATVPLLVLPRIVRRIDQSIVPPESGWFGWTVDRLRIFFSVLTRCMQDRRKVVFLSVMAILVYVTALTGTAICLRAFAGDISASDVIVLTSAFVLSRMINIVPGNLGVSELFTGLSAGVLMDQMMYGVMVSGMFRIIDFAVLGTAWLALAAIQVLTVRHKMPRGG